MSKTKTATIEIYQAFGCYSFCAQVKYYGITLNTFISNDLNEVIELAKTIASEKGFQKTKLNILGG
jgi:hypothetical protein